MKTWVALTVGHRISESMNKSEVRTVTHRDSGAVETMKKFLNLQNSEKR